MTYKVLMGTLNPTHSLTDSGNWLLNDRVPPGHGKSWNLGRPFSRPGKSWKIAKVMESHGK